VLRTHISWYTAAAAAAAAVAALLRLRSLDEQGTLWYLDAASGNLLGSFQTGASIGGGASVARGKVFIGSGYTTFGTGTAGNKAFALGLPSV
jgi:hypothetical protein